MKGTSGQVKIRLLNGGNPVTFLRIDFSQEISSPEIMTTPRKANSQLPGMILS
jgi:hypothetical protein